MKKRKKRDHADHYTVMTLKLTPLKRTMKTLIDRLKIIGHSLVIK